jgi:putative hydrolase of the HAD superfamily
LSPAVSRTPALVFDFGGPVLLTPFELVAISQPGTAAYDLLAGVGPLAPADQPDPEWVAMQGGEFSEREYWDRRAIEWGQRAGQPGTIQALIAHLYDPPREELIRPGAWSLMRDVKAAGRAIGVLTNDLRTFHSDEWVAQMQILDLVEVIVDASVEGTHKPDRRLYELMSERLGVGFADMVFIDDQLPNVVAARELGIPTVHFDVNDPAASYAEARELLSLASIGQGSSSAM